MKMRKEIQIPIGEDERKKLRIYDQLYLNGQLIVARDSAHKRLAALLKEGSPLPLSLKGKVIYYMGPAQAAVGQIIGSCGPTTSARMDPFTAMMMDEGVVATIGKGPRSEEVRDAVKKANGLYLTAFGGCGALYAKCVKKSRVIAFVEDGPEALLEIEVENFPVIVAIDSAGNSVFDKKKLDV